VVTANDGLDEREEDDRGDESSDFTYHHSPLVRELRRLKAVDRYQRRGYDFQDFVGSLFKQGHFRVVPSPGTARPRQTDLLATRGGDAYLIETKWRRSKANVDDIDSLFSRLGAAPAAVVGVMVSFSGFTSGAIERVEQSSNRPVLLVTGSELEQMVEWDEDIAHLLARKKTSLLAHRKAFFATIRRRRRSAPPAGLVVAPTEFAFLDGSRAKWVSGKGDFGEFTFVQDLPDIDWDRAVARHR
jgi:hypothetical protein